MNYKAPKARGEENNLKEVKTSAVLFVENTKDGRLAKNLREVVERIKGIREKLSNSKDGNRFCV